jgi:Fur family peroxide stress response transcriptional regulator
MSSRVEHALQKLKMTGIRMTPQRQAILTYLLESMTHPSADEIYRSLEPDFPNMSVATVYNNLKVFVEAGLVKELTYGDGASRFDADMSDHYHVICDHCGKIVDFEHTPLSQIEREVEQHTGFAVKSHRMELYGTCPDCMKKRSAVH